MRFVGQVLNEKIIIMIIMFELVELDKPRSGRYPYRSWSPLLGVPSELSWWTEHRRGLWLVDSIACSCRQWKTTLKSFSTCIFRCSTCNTTVSTYLSRQEHSPLKTLWSYKNICSTGRRVKKFSSPNFKISVLTRHIHIIIITSVDSYQKSVPHQSPFFFKTSICSTPS